MNIQPETIKSARKLATEVAQKMGLNLTETRSVLDAVAHTPKRAAAAYRAILKSYDCPGCGRPE